MKFHQLKNRIRTRILIVVASLLLAAACSKAPEPGSATNSSAAQSANASGPANTAHIPPEFSGAPPNAVQPPAPGTAVNGAGQPPMKAGPPPKAFEIPGKDGPAPDDSDVKTQLADNLVQTRTFHRDPQIAKVEKTTVLEGGNTKSVVKVYLKNGQVKPIDIRDPLTASAADILKAVH